MGILASLALCSIYLFCVRKKVTIGYVGWSLLFVLYLAIALSEVVGFPCLSEWQRLDRLGLTLYHPNINLTPFFLSGFDLTDLLNVIFFIPFGVALPVMWQLFDRLIPTLIIGMLFSAVIEFAQLFTLYRATDINDLIMNTLGTFLGWFLVKVMFKWRFQRKQKNLDWLLYLLGSMICCFLFG